MTDFKKGGPLQNSNIYATNRLFVKNPLFKKRKKKRAPGVYNPKAKFKYEDGGEQGCPPGQYWDGKKCVDDPFTKGLISQIKKGNESKKPVPSLTRKAPTQPTTNAFTNKPLLNKEIQQKRKRNSDLQKTFPEVEIIGKRPMGTIHGEIPDSFTENLVEFADQSGYFSWDDANQAYQNWQGSDNMLPSMSQAADMFGAVPVLGKLGKLKYLSYPAGAMKSAYKYFPWQQAVNFFDTAEDIDTDNLNQKKDGGSIIDLTEEEIQKYIDGGYIVEEVNDPSIPALNRFDNGGDTKPGVQNLQEATIYDPKTKKEQLSLFQQLRTAKEAYQNYTKQNKGKKWTLNAADPLSSSISDLKKQIQLYKDEFKKEKEETERELKRLESLKKKDAFKNNKDIQNLTLKDLSTVKGKAKLLDAARSSNLSGDEVSALYKGWGLDQADYNVKKGSGPNAVYSAKATEAAAMKDVPQFVNMVSNVATAIPLLGAAGAAGSAGAAILENPYVQAGLTGYGLYDATTNTLPEAYKDFSEGRYLEGAGNVALAGLDLVPGVGLAGKGAKLAGKGLGKIGTKLDQAILNDVSKVNQSGTESKLMDKIYDLDSILSEGLGYLTINKKRQKQIDAGNEWLKKWIEDPVTQSKIDDDFSYIAGRNNPGFDIHDIAYMQSKNFTPKSKMYSLKKQFKDYVKGKKPIHSGNAGVSYLHQMHPYDKWNIETGRTVPGFERYGSWISRNPFLENQTNTAIHEGTHDWVDEFTLTNSLQDRHIRQTLSEDKLKNLQDWETLRKQGKSPAAILGKKKAEEGYLSNPTEIHARIMELRKDFGLTPKTSTEVTPSQAEEMLKKIKKGKTSIDKRFADIIDNNPDKLAFLFKRLWAAPVAITGTGAAAAMMTNPFQGSDGLQQQKKGGATDDYIEVDIPEEEIQWYINQGYRVEPVTKLKKFIG